MARKSYVQIGLELIDKEDYEALARARGHQRSGPGYTVMPDLPDFVSPIDGKRYSGRAGLREHCATHNVVPVADLAGLPPKPAYQTAGLDNKTAAERKQMVINQVNQHWR